LFVFLFGWFPGELKEGSPPFRDVQEFCFQEILLASNSAAAEVPDCYCYRSVYMDPSACRVEVFMLRALARIDTCASSAFSNCQKKKEEIIGSLLAYWTSGRYSSGIDVVP